MWIFGEKNNTVLKYSSQPHWSLTAEISKISVLLESTGLSPRVLQRVAGLRAPWTPGFFHCKAHFQSLMYGQPVLHVKAGSPSFSGAPNRCSGVQVALRRKQLNHGVVIRKSRKKTLSLQCGIRRIEERGKRRQKKRGTKPGKKSDGTEE